MTEQRSSRLAGSMLDGTLPELLEKGANFAAESPPTTADTAILIKKIWSLRPTGPTALGPALAVAVGLCARGGRVVVCTDGLANRGIGRLGNVAAAAAATVLPFYSDIGAQAMDQGVSISVVTLEGEQCAMEHLGTTADLTGGQVEIVDPIVLESKVSNIVSRRTLATRATVSVRGSRGLKVDGQPRATHSLGTISLDTNACFSLSLPDATTDPVQLQVHLHYTGRDGGEYLVVVTDEIASSSERQELEEAMDPEVVAVSAVQRAASLAQGGSYRAARSELISTQRLLQRGMVSVAVQKAYLPFITQAEKLDGFIREREAQEQLEARSSERRRADRDDEAARAIYQMKSLSLDRFREDS